MALTKEELELRRGYLGGSDAAASIGLSKWKTPLQLYREKVGIEEDKDEEEDLNLPMQVGSLVEPLVLLKLEQKKKVTVGERQSVIIDPSWPIRRATVDGIASDGLLVEAKTAGFIGQQWGKDDTDEIPLQYVYQIQHNLAATGLPAAWVPVIIGNTAIRIYRIERDQELIQILTEGEKKFWQHVLDRRPPPATTKGDLKILYPYDIDRMPASVAGPDIKLAITKFEENKARLKTLGAAQEALYAMIGEAFKDSPELVDETGKLLATYKSQAGQGILQVDKMEEDFPGLDIDKYKKRGKPYRVLRIAKPSKAKGKK
jgi:putative phage-type endonuclease